MVGNNLKAHLEHLEKQMRDAAADLDFETAARLRDEIKRLREMELPISDDPLAREVEWQSPVSGREKGKHNKGRALHRAVEEQARSASRRRDGRRRRQPLGRSRCSKTVARRHGARHRHGDAGRRGLALAVQEAVA